MAGRIIGTILVVLVIIYVIPFAVYGALSALLGLKAPGEVSPAQFLLSVLVSKVGTAIAFVVILYFARSALSRRWLLYAFLWWTMYVIGEVGQAIGPNYTWIEAIAGILSETLYFPLSAYLANRLVGGAAAV